LILLLSGTFFFFCNSSSRLMLHHLQALFSTQHFVKCCDVSTAAHKSPEADWAAWHLPGGPVAPASRWAATSNVEVGQTTYPINREGE